MSEISTVLRELAFVLNEMAATYETTATGFGAPPEIETAPGLDGVDSVATVTLDKTGIPHDPRIHSKGATTNADGTWRGKRGVDATILAAVTAELLAAQATVPPVVPVAEAPSAALAAPVVPGDPATTPPPAPVAPVIPVAATPAPVTPVVPAAPVAPVAPAVESPILFAELITGIQKQGFPDEQVQEIITSIDPAMSIPLLPTRPDIVIQVAAALNITRAWLQAPA